MSLDVQVEVKDSYVCLHCRGVYNLKAVLEALEKAFEVAAHHGLDAALLDAREVDGGPTTTDRFQLGVCVAGHAPEGTRLAVLGNDPLVEPARFGETVARNRGADMRVFFDEAAAIAWLGKRPRGRALPPLGR